MLKLLLLMMPEPLVVAVLLAPNYFFATALMSRLLELLLF